MNCPNCGNIIADGSAMCPICGASLAQQQPMGYQQPAYQAAPKKSNTGLIVGIILGIVALIAIVAVVLVFVLKKDDDKSGSMPNGKYVISSMNLEGNVFTASDLASIGYGNMYIEVDGDKMKFDSTGSGATVSYSYTLDGSKGHMSGNGEEFDFNYSGNTITIDFTSSSQFSMYSTYTMDFVKQ